MAYDKDDFVDDMEEMDTSENGKKMMTMDDVADHLQKDFPEEIADAKKYLCMAKIADCAGAYSDSNYLLEMAKDEYTHACFIHDFMERHGMHISEHHEKSYHKLEEEMAHFL